MDTEALWQQMQQDWQSTQPIVDTAALVRQAKWKCRRMIGVQVLEVVSALVATGLCIWATLSVSRFVPALAWILIAIIWLEVAGKAWLRRHTWRSQSAEPQALLELMERRARAGLRFVWLSLAILLACYIAAAPWAWYTWEHGTSAMRGGIIDSAIAECFVVAGGIAWAVWYARRQRAKLRRANAMLAELKDDPTP
jgi:hypothetical protein